mgnify:FL=1
MLDGRFGQTVALKDGNVTLFDEAYIRESIVDPTAKLSAGYEPIMPTYRGQISEEGIIQIISYLKSLGPAAKEGGE